MAQLTQSQLEWYRRNLNAQASEAAKKVLEGIDFTQSVEWIRNTTINNINNVLGVYGDNAQTIAMQLFDFVAQKQGDLDAVADFFDNIIDEDMVDEKVRYYANNVVKGEYAKYARNISDYAEYLVKRSAHDNVVKNCEKNEYRYALVPTGNETCGFCYMLASRGFVYSGKTRAERGTKGFHMHCDCLLLPSKDKNLEVYGYDPDFYTEKLIEAEKKYLWSKSKDPNHLDVKYKEDENGNVKYVYTSRLINSIEKLGKDKGWDYLYNKA